MRLSLTVARETIEAALPGFERVYWEAPDKRVGRGFVAD